MPRRTRDGPHRSESSSSGGKPQAQHTRAAAHAAREGRGAGCGGGCCEGCVRCREGRLRPRERFLHKVFVTCARARSAARSAARRRVKFSSAARRGLQPGDVRAPAGEGARRRVRARAGGRGRTLREPRERLLHKPFERVRGREARRGLQPGDVRSSLRQRGEVCSPATRARAGGRGRGGARSAARRGVRRVGVGEGAAACRSTTRHQLRAAWGYWAAQWHLARAVGKRFRGCRAKRLYVHLFSREKTAFFTIFHRCEDFEDFWRENSLHMYVTTYM